MSKSNDGTGFLLIRLSPTPVTPNAAPVDIVVEEVENDEAVGEAVGEMPGEEE